MTNPNTVVFSSLWLPRPLDLDNLVRFLAHMAADRSAARIVLELRGDEHGVRHLLGCRPTDVHAIRRQLADLIPGSVLGSPSVGTATPRPNVLVGGRLHIHPPGLPLLSDRPEDTMRSLLSAVSAARTAGEHVVVQVVLGPRYAPKVLPARAPDPGRSLVSALLGTAQPASSELRSRMKQRLGRGGFAATLRIGASSANPDRTRGLVVSTLSALATAQSPGVRMDLVKESVDRINRAKLPRRWPLHLAVGELVGLLGWPFGDGDLPGLPPAHPRPLRAARDVHGEERVFAQSAALGEDRLLGISAADQTYHAVAYGPSGSGKTNVLLHLVMADIEAGRAVAVLDPKKQLVDDILSRVPTERLDDVVVLDAADELPVGFNPLDVTGRDPDVVVDGILAVLEAVFRSGWGPRTADIFSACLRTLARASTPKRPATLLDVPTLLTDPAFRRKQIGLVQSDVALAGFWAWFDSQTPQAQGAAIAAPMNKLRQFLLRPALIRMLDARTSQFRVRDLFRQNKVLLVPLNEGLIGPGTASLLGSLVIADLWQATQERADDPAAATTPAVIYVDEAPRFLNLPLALADALAVSRSLGVGWFLAAQFRSQFPPELKSAVDLNARSKIQFATEHDDARDAAKLTQNLTQTDFIALPRFHAYANLVAGGHPSGWALVKTLPPTPAVRSPADARAHARAIYGPPPPEPTEPAGAASSPAADASTSQERVGRKRRRP